MTRPDPSVFCLGGATIDRSYDLHAPHVPATSNPVSGRMGFGGVARNVAENLARLEKQVSFFSLVGMDANGEALTSNLTDLGINHSTLVSLADAQTAEYVALMDPNGELVTGMANMAIFDRFTPQHIAALKDPLQSADWVFFDCNLTPSAIEQLQMLKPRTGTPMACDGVSTAKIMKLPEDLSFIDLLFLNLDEACACLNQKLGIADALDALIAKGVASIVLTCGAKGAHMATRHERFEIPAMPLIRPVDVTGAGDALIAGTLSGLVEGLSLPDAVRRGTITAALTIETIASVHPKMSPELVLTRQMAHSA